MLNSVSSEVMVLKVLSRDYRFAIAEEDGVMVLQKGLRVSLLCGMLKDVVRGSEARIPLSEGAYRQVGLSLIVFKILLLIYRGIYRAKKSCSRGTH